MDVVKTRGVGLVIAVVLLAASLMAGAAAPALAEGLARVRLATLAPSALLWLHYIAQDQKFYERRGLQVLQVQISDSAVLVQSVASGSAEAGVALGDNVMRAVDRGAPVVITGAILYKPILRLIGATDDVASLRGKRVTAGAVEGGTTDLLLYQLLKKGGLTRNDVLVVAMPNSRDRLVALRNGQLAGALLIAPFDVEAIRDGFKVLDVYREPWLETPLIVNVNWAQKNRAVASGLTLAMRDAARWIYDPKNREQAVQILARYTGIAPDVVQEAYEFIVRDQKAISPDLTVPEDSVRNILRIQRELYGGPEQPFELSRYYDSSFLQGR